MNKLDVYYDGDCSICRIEVAYYKRRDRDGLIDWLDITKLSGTQLSANKSHAQLLGKFHTADSEGTWPICVDFPFFKNSPGSSLHQNFAK